MSNLIQLESDKETSKFEVTVRTPQLVDEFLRIQEARKLFCSRAMIVGLVCPNEKPDLDEAYLVRESFYQALRSDPGLSTTAAGASFLEAAADYISALMALQAVGFVDLFYQMDEDTQA